MLNKNLYTKKKCRARGLMLNKQRIAWGVANKKNSIKPVPCTVCCSVLFYKDEEVLDVNGVTLADKQNQIVVLATLCRGAQ